MKLVKGFLLVTVIALWSITGLAAAHEVLRVVVGPLPLTGPAARTGQEMWVAICYAFDEIGYQVGPYKIELVPVDCMSDPAKGAAGYEEAVVGKGAQVGLSGWHSSVGVAVMPIAARYKIPHFFSQASTEVINEMYHLDPAMRYWIAKGWPVAAKLTIAYVDALHSLALAGKWVPEDKTVFLWGEDTDWGRTFVQASKEQWEAVGWKVVGMDFFPLGQVEFMPLLHKVMALNPAVFMGTTTSPPAMSALLRQAYEVGLRSVIVADGLAWVANWYELTGEASDYVLDSIPIIPEVARPIAEGIKRKYGLEITAAPGLMVYEQTKFFIKILERTLEVHGKLTSETIFDIGVKEVKTGKLTYQGFVHNYVYTPETVPDPVVGKGYFLFPVVQYKGGEAVVIWPAEWATGEFMLRR